MYHPIQGKGIAKIKKIKQSRELDDKKLQSKQSNYFIFRALGKILYSKSLRLKQFY